MALILNLETATSVCSVALSKDGKVIGLKEINNGYTHAENLTGFIQSVLNETGHVLNDVDAVAVSKGPGSYTGLRIGVATAKGICYGTGKPLIGVDTMRSFTYLVQSLTFKVQRLENAISGKELYCPMIDARRMEVYCAVYDRDLNCMEPVQAKVIDGDSFSVLLNSGKVFFFGDGAMKCREVLGAHPNAVFIENASLSASGMAPFSEKAFGQKGFEELAYFEPFYLKDFVSTGTRIHTG